MTKIKGSSYDVGFDADVWDFMYTVATEHLDWDLSFLGLKLSAMVDKWHVGWRASLPLSDEPPVPSFDELLRTPSGKLMVIALPLEVHLEQVIDADPVVNLKESDENRDDLERIDDPRGNSGPPR